MKKTVTIAIALLCAIAQGAWAQGDFWWGTEGTETDPFIIENSNDWALLEMRVRNGDDYSGKVLRLTRDIEVSSGLMIGTAENPFNGTIDGDGHTLTFNMGTADSPVSGDCAPFLHVSGATIRHLTTDGTVYTKAKFAGGLVSRISGTTSTYITDCHSTMTIGTAVGGDGTHGGLVAVVSENTGPLFMEHCSFTGSLLNTGSSTTTSCGGFIGFARTPVTITDGLFDPAAFEVKGVNFVRMSEENMSSGKMITLTDCYTTFRASMNTQYPQGTFLLDHIDMSEGCTYEFVGEPDMSVNGTNYYKSGCYVHLTVPEEAGFNHWEDTRGGSYISDPWRSDGIHQLKDVKDVPFISAKATGIPAPVTERTLWGVKYRYLSRKDYHYYISDEDLKTLGWTFRDGSSDANLIVKTNGKESLVTAITGYDESGYNSDGVQIHNDLYATLWRDHTHLGLIAPRAFKGSTKLTSLYLKDTNGNTEGAQTDFQFIIGEGAFEDCPNLKELKMMQYTTTGSNRWEMIRPDQVSSVAAGIFEGSAQARISCHREVYQDYLNSPTWKDYKNRIIIYDATVEDFAEKGARYHKYRDKTETKQLSNHEKDQMMENHTGLWNADYQKFSSASLLSVNDESANIYYTSVVGADNGYLDSHDGVMRIYNDPGSFYNYKTICVGRNAFAGNEHLKAIEFAQTNGRAENSFSDLKIVIQNGAFKGCKNLRELRMYYWAQDGDDHWETLGPEDVIPGDNIFGIPTDEEYAQMTQEEYLASPVYPEAFRIVVSPARYDEFIDDPNWAPYRDFIVAADYEPTKWDPIEVGGVTYDYASKTVSTASTNQVVTQSLSWWNVPIKIYEIYTLYTLAKSGVSLVKALQEYKESGAKEFIADAARILNSEMQPQYNKAMLDISRGRAGLYDFANVLTQDANNYMLRHRASCQALMDLGIIEVKATKHVWTENALQILRSNAHARTVFLDGWEQTAQSFFRDQVAIMRTNIDQFFAPGTNLHKYLHEGLGNLSTGAQMGGVNIIGHLIGNAYSSYQGLNGEMTAEEFQRGLVENMKANIHNVSYENTLVYTPEKKLIYHMYLKSAAANRDSITIYNDVGSAWNYRTVAIRKDAFRGNTTLQKVGFAENASSSADSYVPMQLAIPDSAFAGCSGLRRFSLTYKTRKGGFRGLGPENFILGGDSIFAGCDSTKLQIVIPADRKQDFLDDEIWSKYQRFFVYEEVKEDVSSSHTEFGVGYAYAYDGNTTRRVSKVSGHTIEHMVAVKTDEKFLREHQGAMGLFNDIGVYNNYKLDEVKKRAFAGSQALRTVSFWDLKGWAWTGDSYTTLDMRLGDECFANCPNLANIDMLYCVTDGDNHIVPLKPSQVRAGENMFDGSPGCVVKMLPQQVAWFEADTAWAKYKDYFRPCIIRPGDGQVKKALKSMAYYTPCASPSKWDNYIDIFRIAGAGWKWLDGKLSGKDIRSFSEFKYFESAGLDYIGDRWFERCGKLSNIGIPATVKSIGAYAFNECGSLPEIELPASVEQIGDKAFANCGKLKKVVVRGTTPPVLNGSQQFTENSGLKIYVPDASVAAYKEAWPQYAAYIVSNNNNKVNKRVVVPEPGKLAEQLGLEIETSYLFMAGQQMEYLHGNYAQFDSLTVSGRLNGADLAVLRYLAGEDSHTKNGRHTDGQLRYLNLADATFIKDTSHPYRAYGEATEWWLRKQENDNELGQEAFMNCDMLETIILPKSLKNVQGDVFKGCTSLKQVAVLGDGTAFGKSVRFITTINFPLLDNPLSELVYLTDHVAAENSKDAWGQDIQEVYTRKSQLADYLDVASLTRRAHSLVALFEDDAVMEALAAHEHYFPSEYLQLESVEGLFSGDEKMERFEDFYLFQNVKRLGSTFNGCSKLRTIALPMSVGQIGYDAFQGCMALDTIHVLSDSVPDLAPGTFDSLPADFVIFVPKATVRLYRERWAEYAEHINPEREFSLGDALITVTLTEPNTLAEKLGLTVTAWDKHTFKWNNHDVWFIKKLSGDYSHITQLKVNGPISGSDLAVLRHLGGYTPWNDCRNYLGHLEYLDLYDANLVATYHDGSPDEYLNYILKHIRPAIVEGDNELPAYSFLKCYSLKTLILPRTATQVMERAIQECENLETLVIGDDIKDFNWNALDDDVSLSRLYILAKKKPKISAEFPIWRWLCNNYNPTFEAFYVRPSLYEDYAYDSNYTGSSWQRTNNVTSGAFSDDESFCAFAAHAAAALDDLSSVMDVKGWFDSHPGIKDLTSLRYTSVDTLRASDVGQLKMLEKIALPQTMEVIEDNAFANSLNLRYIDGLLGSDELAETFSSRGFTPFGIDSLQTLVYLPEAYGEPKGTNIVVSVSASLPAGEAAESLSLGGKSLGACAETFRLADGKDYCVPYPFDANAVENSRVLEQSAVPYTVCLPYALEKPQYSRVYKLSERDGSTLTFIELSADEQMEALQPYLVKAVGNKRLRKTQISLNSSRPQTIPASGGNTFGRQQDVPGYSMRGTLDLVSNAEAAGLGAYILQSDGDWHPVTTAHERGQVMPFRAFLLPSARNGSARISMTLEDSVSGSLPDGIIDTIETIDTDGTRRYYDLNGREVDVHSRGIIIHDGKKIINK